MLVANKRVLDVAEDVLDHAAQTCRLLLLGDPLGLSGGPLNNPSGLDDTFLADDGCRDVPFDDRLPHLGLDDGLLADFLNLGASVLLSDHLLVLLVDHWLVKLVHDLAVLLMNDWLVNLANLLLVDDRLDVLVDHLLMMLVHDVLMMLMHDLLMMLMDHVLVMLLHNGCVHMRLHSCRLLVGYHLGLGPLAMGLHLRLLVVTNDLGLLERLLNNGLLVSRRQHSGPSLALLSEQSLLLGFFACHDFLIISNK